MNTMIKSIIQLGKVFVFLVIYFLLFPLTFIARNYCLSKGFIYLNDYVYCAEFMSTKLYGFAWVLTILWVALIAYLLNVIFSKKKEETETKWKLQR